MKQERVKYLTVIVIKAEFSFLKLLSLIHLWGGGCISAA